MRRFGRETSANEFGHDPCGRYRIIKCTNVSLSQRPFTAIVQKPLNQELGTEDNIINLGLLNCAGKNAGDLIKDGIAESMHAIGVDPINYTADGPDRDNASNFRRCGGAVGLAETTAIYGQTLNSINCARTLVQDLDKTLLVHTCKVLNGDTRNAT